MRFRVTIVAEYDVHPNNYTDPDDPWAMAGEDLMYFTESPSEAIHASDETVKITVEPI